MFQFDVEAVLLGVRHSGGILFRCKSGAFREDEQQHGVGRLHQCVQRGANALGVVAPVALQKDKLAKVKDPADNGHVEQFTLGISFRGAQAVGHLAGHPVKEAIQLKVVIADDQTVLLSPFRLCLLVGEEQPKANLAVPFEENGVFCVCFHKSDHR